MTTAVLRHKLAVIHDNVFLRNLLALFSVPPQLFSSGQVRSAVLVLVGWLLLRLVPSVVMQRCRTWAPPAFQTCSLCASWKGCVTLKALLGLTIKLKHQLHSGGAPFKYGRGLGGKGRTGSRPWRGSEQEQTGWHGVRPCWEGAGAQGLAAYWPWSSCVSWIPVSGKRPLGVLLEYLFWVNFPAEKSSLCAEMSPRYKPEGG